MQPPVNIPSRSRNSTLSSLQSSQDGARYQASSPDPFRSQSSAAQYPLALDSDQALPTTPILHQTTVLPTTPTSYQRRRPPLQPHASFSSTRNPQSQRDRHPEHQWSLFGQLMENEGLLPASPVSSRRSRQDSSQSDYFVHDSGSVTGSSIRGLGISSLQASISDARMSGATSPVRQGAIRNSLTGSLDGIDYDSNDSESITSTIHQPIPAKSSMSSLSRYLTLSPVSRNILKCAIAYFIASLFTFSPFFSKLITDMDVSGPSASGHMVATM